MNRIACILLGAALLTTTVGCASQHATVVDSFPPAALADPWTLNDDVWQGSFAAAAPALGDEADRWARFGPQHVWLAIYTHAHLPHRKLTVRCFSYTSTEQARRAYEHFMPNDAQPYAAGDAGCWTDLGVLFCWGKLVFDIFGQDAPWDSQLQSGALAAYITNRMPAHLPDDPQ